MTELDSEGASVHAAAAFTGAIHATSIVIDGYAILIGGKSGAGKSDLALRMIDRGAMLLSDDYTVVTRQGGAVLASTPPEIAGQMEVRGIGILSMPCAPPTPVALILQQETTSQPAERYPFSGRTLSLCGLDIAALILDFMAASAPIKAELALRHVIAPLAGRNSL